ncbi:hypothetical protein HPULCUR_003555 [Helicostylum pulchrum]|uniref:Uncharacterized protein n=1 Tax=Helicostylum pulchrum TaxID=562976 RepID=A0ABP9XV27_9FUNG
MNTYNLQRKRCHRSSFDSDQPPFGLPRKKFVSEESFAKEMAAMSLEPIVDPNRPQEINFSRASNTYYNISDDEEEEEEEVNDSMMTLDSDGKPIINVDRNGLPMEIRPGENKPRIPDFVLKNSELTDPRDILAYQRMIQSLQNKPHKHKEIEVLNKPSDYFIPTSMDID